MPRSRPISIALLPLALLTLASCGGGGGSNPTGGSGGGTQMVGSMELSGSLSATPTYATSSAVTATGIVGEINRLSLFETRSVEDTWIGMRRDAMEGTGWSVSPSGLGMHEFLPKWILGFDWSPDGTKLAVSTSSEIYTVNADGTGYFKVKDGYYGSPRWSPDGTLILASTGGNLYSMQPNGASYQLLVANAGNASFSPDMYWIVFERGTDVYIMRSNATGVRLLSYGSSSPKFLSDSKRVVVSCPVGDGTYNISLKLAEDTGGSPGVIATSPHFITSLLVGPDDSIAYAVVGDDYYTTVYRRAITDTYAIELTRVSYYAWLESWSPMTPLTKTFVASTGGLLNTLSSGAVFTETAQGIAAVVSFRATTPTSGKLKLVTSMDNQSPTIVYQADMDTCIALAYAQGPEFRRVDVVGGTAGIKPLTGALIATSSETGRVTSIFTYKNLGTLKPDQVKRTQGNEMVFTGDFVSIINDKGVNLAPSGAQEVALDLSTGAPRVIR